MTSPAPNLEELQRISDNLVFRMMDDLIVAASQLAAMCNNRMTNYAELVDITAVVCEILTFGGSKERIIRLLNASGLRVAPSTYNLAVPILRSVELSFRCGGLFGLNRHRNRRQSATVSTHIDSTFLNFILASQFMEPGMFTPEQFEAMLQRFVDQNRIFCAHL